MEITPGEFINTEFTEKDKKKVSDFMQGYLDAFESFGKSTSANIVDYLFGDSSISFRDIARKLVKDLLTNTLHFLVIDPLVKDIQKVMTSIFQPSSQAVGGFDAAIGANTASGGGIGGALDILGGALSIFGGKPASGSMSMADPSALAGVGRTLLPGDLTNKPSQFLQSPATVSSTNNYFNITTKDAASFQDARGRIANNLQRSTRHN